MSTETCPVAVLNQHMKNPISAQRRELMLRAMDGDSDLSGVMFILNDYRFCDNFLIFLIAHHYTGKSLRDLIVGKFKSSVPGLVAFCVDAMKKYDSVKTTASPSRAGSE